MLAMTLLEIFDLLGVLAFSISGALAALRKKLDPFGVFIIAFVTAVGGGTLRDVLVGHYPLAWMENFNSVYAVIAGTIIAIFFRAQLKRLSNSLFLFDAIGLGLFTISGTKIGLAADLNPGICIALGTMTASFGGVIRDILCNEIPVIFRKEIYATICILGASLFLLLDYFEVLETINYVATMIIVVVLRVLVAALKISLPNIYREKA